jgi:hypothetical protein
MDLKRQCGGLSRSGVGTFPNQVAAKPGELDTTTEITSAKSSDCVLANFRPAITISYDNYNRAGVHSHKCLEMDSAKNN